ncbi:MAG: hypothetical protein NUW23_13580 [Firmicutes bacterium]|nr:hypothetical protein [Bacillota bacterium]
MQPPLGVTDDLAVVSEVSSIQGIACRRDVLGTHHDEDVEIEATDIETVLSENVFTVPTVSMRARLIQMV